MDYEQEKDGVKKRRILDRDFDAVEKFVKDEYESRKKNSFRKKHENKWKEVDRQIEMDPPRRVAPDGREIKGNWTSALELGELSKASEIIAADVMRIIFANENWHEDHVDIEGVIDPQSGQMVIPAGDQARADGLLRSLLNQQHKDFGLKARFKLSVKEALHHGSFVAECRWDEQMMSDGAKIKQVAAPVWQPYSMWNAYPDPSPSVIGTNLFYTGSMILVEYMPLHKVKRMSGAGWMPSRLKKVKKEEHKDKDNETKDAQLIRYYGDICIERQDGDIYLPNMKVILANGTLVYAKECDLPHSPIIFAGYERQDVRDPYYTSPIIKQSPTQKLTTVMANEFIDAIRLRTKPPVEYDANDPDYVQNGGPDLSPGGKTPTKSMGKGMKTLEVGDPVAALRGMEFGFRQLQEGLGVSSMRQGSQSSDRQTATEAKIMEQGSEVRTIDFIGGLEQQGLRPFLYMQHALNRKNLKSYTIYSNELNTPDMVVITRQDIDRDAHFDVVGAKGILGEKERQQQVSQVTIFASQNPLFAPLLQPERILMDMYKDAGKRNPEEWVQTQKAPQIPPELQAQMQQMQQMLQMAQAKIQELESERNLKLAKLEIERKKAEAELMLKQATLELQRSKTAAGLQVDAAQSVEEAKAAMAELALRREEMNREFALKAQEIRNEMTIKLAELQLQRENDKKEHEMELEKVKKKPRKTKVRKTADGYEVEDS